MSPASAWLGHSFEMAQGSSCTIHLTADQVPYHPEALELADMGFLPAGAYRNRSYAEAGVTCRREIPRPLMDLFFDPQTSGGLLIALPEAAAPGLSCPAAGCHSLRRLHRLCHRTGGQLDRAGVTLRKTWGYTAKRAAPEGAARIGFLKIISGHGRRRFRRPGTPLLPQT